MAIAIRPARRGEAGLVLDFVRELAQYERLLDTMDATEAMMDASLFGADPRVFCEIAEWDEQPAGFALWFRNFSSFRGRHGIYLEDLFVRPPYRRRGIGRAMFAHLATRCMQEGWTRFEWSVLDWNKSAIEFYRTMGAQVADDWRICRLTGPALERLAAARGA